MYLAMPSKPKPDQAKHRHLGQARPNQARPGQAKPSQARPGKATWAKPGQARQSHLGQARPGQPGLASKRVISIMKEKNKKKQKITKIKFLICFISKIKFVEAFLKKTICFISKITFWNTICL